MPKAAARGPAKSALPARRTQRGLAEAAERLDALGAKIGAEGFAVLLADPPGHQGRLMPLVDSDHPRTSAASRRIAERSTKALSARIRGSSVPFHWHKGRDRDAPAGLLVDRQHLLPLDTGYVALPMHDERDRLGIAIFHGRRLAFTDLELVELHLQVLRIFARLKGRERAAAARRPAVSGRELDCLRLTADGKTSGEIAALLGLSPHTATQYLGTAATKLDAVNRTHAIAKALRSGLIS